MEPMRRAGRPPTRGTLRARVLLGLAGTALVGTASAGAAQEPAGDGAWFGVPLPPGRGEVPAVVVGERGPAPAAVPAGEEGRRELWGEMIWRDLEAIVGFSRASRSSREIGEGQLWGRVSGFPSGLATVEWMAGRFREAGVADVEVQPFRQEGDASFWLPLAWEVRLLADPSFGPGTEDVVLESAMPLSPSDLPGGTIVAPVVYVGTARGAELAHVDVRGKIAVQEVVPQGHMVFERAPTVPRAQALMERGALAVLNVVRLPGNEHARDFSNCGGPCFNVGGRDGWFLQNVLDRATAAGAQDRLRARLTLRAERRTGLSAANAVAVLPGSASAEAIVVNAHVDGWFDGAGDNADGAAVLLALARHFARPENRPERTLVFVASAGHHSPGLNGPRSFVAMNPDLGEDAVLVINVEHVAQRNVSPARTEAPDGYRDFVADAGEAPIVAGVTNSAPFLDGLLTRGVERYGVNFISERSTHCGGECGGFASLGTPRVGLMQAPPLYHTSGEGIEMISVPGLERAARFLAFFIGEVDRAPRGLFDS